NDKFLEQPDGDPADAFNGSRSTRRGQGTVILDKTFGPVNGSGGVRREEDQIGDVFAEREGGQLSRLAISQCMNEPERDIREAEPLEIASLCQIQRAAFLTA